MLRNNRATVENNVKNFKATFLACKHLKKRSFRIGFSNKDILPLPAAQEDGCNCAADIAANGQINGFHGYRCVEFMYATSKPIKLFDPERVKLLHNDEYVFMFLFRRSS